MERRNKAKDVGFERSPQRIAVTALSQPLEHKAENLAAELGLPFISSTTANEETSFAYLLVVTPDFIGLQKMTNKKEAPFYIDFTSGKIRYRSEQAGLRNELLARALGVKPRDNPRIIDATAGLGRDSFILATLGFQITLLERSPILHVLLQDALQRAQKLPDLAPIIARMRLIHTNAIDWLKGLREQERPQVIYLDPMFPARKKSASVKKEMAILQDLLGNDEDSDQLVKSALTCATSRVVIKRPRLAPNIVERAPNFTFTGKTNRFDVYLT